MQALEGEAKKNEKQSIRERSRAREREGERDFGEATSLAYSL